MHGINNTGAWLFIDIKNTLLYLACHLSEWSQYSEFERKIKMRWTASCKRPSALLLDGILGIMYQIIADNGKRLHVFGYRLVGSMHKNFAICLWIYLNSWFFVKHAHKCLWIKTSNDHCAATWLSCPHETNLIRFIKWNLFAEALFRQWAMYYSNMFYGDQITYNHLRPLANCMQRQTEFGSHNQSNELL